jgi:Fanconi anemia group M protein
MENYHKIENIHLIKQKRISNDINEQKLNIIASIPFIGEKYAERLLKNFKTIKNIINASSQELSSKANIPYKTLIKICKILNEEYKGIKYVFLFKTSTIFNIVINMFL